MVGTHGGGAFLIPYVIAVAACGLPLMILEFALGRRVRSSVVPAFAAIRPGLRWLGYGLVLVQTMILAYYLVVTGWVLAYFLAFAAGAPLTFAAFTDSYVPLLFFLLAGGLCFLVVQSGVRSGLERLCNKDFAFGTVGMTLGAVVLSVAAGWFVRERLLPGPLMVVIRVVVPVALAASLVARLADWR